MFSVTESIIAEYERLLAGQILRIPNSYFTDYSPRQKEMHALTIIRYALKKLLKLNGRQALQLFDKEMMYKLKLDGVIKYIQFPFGLPKNSLFYVIYAAYPGEFPEKEEATILYIYERALEKNKRIPSTFFDGEEGKFTAATALRYQLDFLGLNTAELYAYFADEGKAKILLRKYKLFRVLNKCFRTPLEYLHYSLPYNKKSDFWFSYYMFKKNFYLKKKEILKCEKR